MDTKSLRLHGNTSLHGTTSEGLLKEGSVGLDLTSQIQIGQKG